MPSPDRVGYSTDDQPEVEVLYHGVWCFGLLAEWRKIGGRWRGTVRFNVQPGENRMEDFDQDDIRPYVPTT